MRAHLSQVLSPRLVLGLLALLLLAKSGAGAALGVRGPTWGWGWGSAASPSQGPVNAAHGWGEYRQPPSQQGFTPAPKGPWVEESSQVFLESHLTLTISTIPLRNGLQVRLLTNFTQLGSGEAEMLTCVCCFHV